MTRKELQAFYDTTRHCKIGYCCYQNDGLSRISDEMYILGHNYGVYGWNWTAYLYAPTNTLYISNYRNVPSYIKEK